MIKTIISYILFIFNRTRSNYHNVSLETTWFRRRKKLQHKYNPLW